jgi:hypothetical protein
MKLDRRSSEKLQKSLNFKVFAPQQGASSAEREVELLQQQLSLKDAIIESKDAVIEAKDKLLAQRADLASPAGSSADTTALAQRLDAAEERLQQLEAAGSAHGGASSVELPCEQKRARHAPTTALPLEEDEVLDEIFGYVGRLEWLYAGGVCRRWRGRYLSMCYKARASKADPVYQTRHSSSFATAARFSLALGNGLKMPQTDNEVGKFFDDLPKLSQQPIDVLTLARVHGAAWHSNMCTDAAYFGNLELLKWLHAAGCPWDAFHVAFNSIRGKSQYSLAGKQYERILHWLFTTVEQWSQDEKNVLLFEAGLLLDAPALKLMRANGAEWPSSYIGEQVVIDESVRACWSHNSVAWALSNGFSWGEWRCQDLTPELYVTQAWNRYRAVNLFKWAHKNGCPCTCEAAAADDVAEVAA